MAKSKNHTNHNQNYKNHRNGIKNVPKNRYIGSKGVNQKLLRNLKRARKFDPSIKKQKALTGKIDFLRKNKAKLLEAIRARKFKAVQAKNKTVATKDEAPKAAAKAK